MDWTWDEINRDWLAGNAIAVQPADVVTAFETADRLLGRDWINAQRYADGTLFQGTLPTLNVIIVGQLLQNIEGCVGADQLIDRLSTLDRSSFRAAFVELIAIYLCAGDDQVEIELEPEIWVGDRRRKPDFRIRHANREWIYVEVAAPDLSETRRQAEETMERIGQAIDTVPSGTAIDILFHREPTIAEVDAIIAHLEVLASDPEPSVNEFADIALLAKNMTLPSDLTLTDHGEPYTPRLGLARFQGELPKAAHKGLSVRYPFADDRAETFLTNEAKQLPNTAPGVIMLATTDAPGAFREWSAILGRRLQPNMHTRVSAICLFEAGFEPTVDGEA